VQTLLDTSVTIWGWSWARTRSSDRTWPS